jgi:hypothetical protein
VSLLFSCDLFGGVGSLTLFCFRHVKTLVGEIDFSFHALNPSGTNPGGLSMKANDKTE